MFKLGTKVDRSWRGWLTGQLERSGSTKMTSAFLGTHLTSQPAHKNNFQYHFNAETQLLMLMLVIQVQAWLAHAKT